MGLERRGGLWFLLTAAQDVSDRREAEPPHGCQLLADSTQSVDLSTPPLHPMPKVILLAHLELLSFTTKSCKHVH